jgi:hypothetical protein
MKKDIKKKLENMFEERVKKQENPQAFLDYAIIVTFLILLFLLANVGEIW